MHLQPRLLELDGLRAISILIVVASHLLGVMGISNVIPGGLGVTIFFFISGFIITRLLLQEHIESGNLNLPAFYVRRFFRLAPALVIFTVISSLSFISLGLPLPISDICAALFYYANYHQIYTGFNAILREHTIVLSPLGITWSLAIEEHFYLLFPAALLVMRWNIWRLLASLVLFVIAVNGWRLFLVFGIGITNVPPERISIGTDTRLDSIVYGCILSVLMHYAEMDRNALAKKTLRLLQGTAGLFFSGSVLLLSLIIRSEPFRETIRYTFQGVALIPLFCALFWRPSPPKLLSILLANGPIRFIGTISYSLYLYHFLAISIIQWVFRTKSPGVRAGVAFALAFAGALFSYYLVERVPRRFGARLATRMQQDVSA